MKNSKAIVMVLLLVVAASAAGQSSVKLPGDYSGKLLRKYNGEIVRFESDDMKGRATRKTDISGFVKQADIKGTVIIDVLVGPGGQVVCEKTLVGHPMLNTAVEKAVRAWTFKPAKANGDAVAYLGRMEFHLCDIGCGEEGMSMSIVK
jgi:TonB family protein